MKTYEQMADEVFARGEVIISRNRIKAKHRRIAVITAVICAAVGISTAVTVVHNKPKILSETVDETVQAVMTEKVPDENSADGQTQPTQKTASTTQNGISSSSTTTLYSNPNPPNGDTPDTPDGGDFPDGSQTAYGGFFIACLPVKRDITYTGEKLTDDEADEYFSKNGDSIISSLASSGIETDSIRFSPKGYSHIEFHGNMDEGFQVKLNYRDYLVYNGLHIISIVTLYKEDGVIYSSPAFGALWFDGFASYLSAHAGEELIFAYAGAVEIVVSPDGKVSNPMGQDMSSHFPDSTETYAALYCPPAVYIP